MKSDAKFSNYYLTCTRLFGSIKHWVKRGGERLTVKITKYWNLTESLPK